MTSKTKMPERDIPDQTIVNLEAYLMGTNPPADIAVAFAKLAHEVRRRRFDAIGEQQDIWRKQFVRFAKHLPVCHLMLDERCELHHQECTCGLMELMKKANK